jgi:hypothetical protein
MSKLHELKTWPKYFQPILENKKTFELREDDRNFAVGDVLTLKEWTPCPRCHGSGREWDNGDKCTCGNCLGKKTITGYTGRELSVEVLYILKSVFLRDRYCVMSILPVSNK